MVDNYERLFGSKPTPAASPLDKGDHPELDSSKLLGIKDVKIHVFVMVEMEM